jgi:hypothetical protein
MASILSAFGKMKFITLNREVHKWAGIVLSLGVLVITVTGLALLHDKSWTWLKRTEVPSLLIPAWAVEGEREKAQDVKALVTAPGGDTAGLIMIGTKAGLYQGAGSGVTPMALPAWQTEVTALLLTEAQWLVGTPHGLLSSTDQGRSWVVVTEGPWGGKTRTKVNVLAAHPASSTTIYAGTKMGLYRSIDGGLHWENLSGRFADPAASGGGSEEMDKKREVMTIAFVKDHPSTVLFGTHRGLYRYESDLNTLSPVDLSAASATLTTPPMTWAKYLNDLHTGKLFAHKLWIVYDLTAIGLAREQAQLRAARRPPGPPVSGERPLPHQG